MNSLLRLTNVPCLAHDYEQEIAQPAGNETDTLTDTSLRMSDQQTQDNVAWYNNIGTGAVHESGASQRDAVMAHKAYRRMRDFLDGKVPPADSLLDHERLAAIGLPGGFLGEFLRGSILKNNNQYRETGHKARVDNTHMAVYLNTLGLEPNVANNVLMRFFDEDLKQAYRDEPGKDKTATDGLVETALTAGIDGMDNLTPEQVEAMCAANRKPHVKKSALDKRVESSVSDLTACIRHLIEPKTFNIQTVLSALSYQFLEPSNALDLFNRTVTSGGSMLESVIERDQESGAAAATMSFTALDPEPQYIGNDGQCNQNIKEAQIHSITLSSPGVHKYSRLLDVLTSKPVRLVDQRLNVMTHRLYSIVQSRQYRVRNGFNTAALDVLLPVLLSANFNLIRPVHSIVTFSAVSALTYSNTVLTSIECGERALAGKKCATDLWSIMIREWERQMWFVVYLELCQQLCPPLCSLRVGCVDDFEVDGDRVMVRTDPYAADHKDRTRYIRRLARDHIYYSRGRYYLWWTWDDPATQQVHERRFSCTDYRTLIELYYLDKVFRKRDNI